MEKPRLESGPEAGQIPVIDLSAAGGERSTWDRPRAMIYLWAITELLLVTNSWQISSRLRIFALRAFGAEIGNGVIFRPRTRVKFPWKLHIGDSSWIGEGVWFHNQDHVYVGRNCVISQESFITTGSHDHRRDMSLITRPVVLEDGVWLTTRCLVLGGTHVGRSALATPGSVISGHIPANQIVGSKSHILGERFAPMTNDSSM